MEKFRQQFRQLLFTLWISSLILGHGQAIASTEWGSFTVKGSTSLQGATSTQVDVDNVRVDGNTISTTNSNGNLIFDLNGTGKLEMTDSIADTVPYLDSNKRFTSSLISQAELESLNGVTTNLSEILTLDGQASTPSNPSAGFYKIYVKDSTGKPAILDSNGTESSLASGGTGSTGINLLAEFNPRAEEGTTSWSETGGGTISTTSTAANVANGSFSFSYDASANNDYAASDAQTVKAGLFGGNCLAQFYYKGFDSNIVAQVYDGSNVLNYQTLSAATNFTPVQIVFPCPSSGTLQLRFLASADAAIGYWDEVHLGSALNLTNIHMVGPWQSYSPTISGFGNTSSSGFQYRRVGDSIEIKGYWTNGTVAASLASITLPTGLTINSSVLNRGNTTSNPGHIVGNYGNNATANNGYMVTATGTSSTLIYFGDSFGSAVSQTPSNGSDLATNSTTMALQTGLIPITEWAGTVSALTPDQAAGLWSGYHDSTCSWSRTNTAYGDPTADATCTFTETRNSNFGTVTSALSAGNKLPGITFTPSKVGTYYICPVISSFETDTAGAIGALQLIDSASNVIAQVSTRTDGTYVPVTLCGLYRPASLTSETIKIQTRGSAGDVIMNSAATTAYAITWTIFAIEQALPTTLLVNSVTNSSSGVTRVEAANLNCDASSTVNSQLGSWVSIGNISGGECAVSFTAGTFSAAPKCSATLTTRTGGVNDPDILSFTGAATTSGVTTDGARHDATDLTSYDFDLICVGAH